MRFKSWLCEHNSVFKQLNQIIIAMLQLVIKQDVRASVCIDRMSNPSISLSNFPLNGGLPKQLSMHWHMTHAYLQLPDKVCCTVSGIHIIANYDCIVANASFNYALLINHRENSNVATYHIALAAYLSRTIADIKLVCKISSRSDIL